MQHSFVVQGVELSHVAWVWLAWHVVVRTLLCRYIRIALTFSIEESETAEDRQPHGWYSVDLRHGAAQGFSWPGVRACPHVVGILIVGYKPHIHE